MKADARPSLHQHMRTTQSMAVLAGLLLAVPGFAQGGLRFENTVEKPVINGLTGAPVATGVAHAGLYWTPDLNAVPNLDAPTDAFELAIQFVGTVQIPGGFPAMVPISLSSSLSGVYLGGTVRITGAPDYGEVLVQVRAWSQQFNSYADAFRSGTALIGASNLMRFRIRLPPDESIRYLVSSFTITPVPEPSTVLLAFLSGLGALVLLRRRS